MRLWTRAQTRIIRVVCALLCGVNFRRRKVRRFFGAPHCGGPTSLYADEFGRLGHGNLSSQALARYRVYGPTLTTSRRAAAWGAARSGDTDRALMGLASTDLPSVHGASKRRNGPSILVPTCCRQPCLECGECTSYLSAARPRAVAAKLAKMLAMPEAPPLPKPVLPLPPLPVASARSSPRGMLSGRLSARSKLGMTSGRVNRMRRMFDRVSPNDSAAQEDDASGEALLDDDVDRSGDQPVASTTFARTTASSPRASPSGIGKMRQLFENGDTIGGRPASFRPPVRKVLAPAAACDQAPCGSRCACGTPAYKPHLPLPHPLPAQSSPGVHPVAEARDEEAAAAMSKTLVASAVSVAIEETYDDHAQEEDDLVVELPALWDDRRSTHFSDSSSSEHSAGCRCSERFGRASSRVFRTSDDMRPASISSVQSSNVSSIRRDVSEVVHASFQHDLSWSSGELRKKRKPLTREQKMTIMTMAAFVAGAMIGAGGLALPAACYHGGARGDRQTSLRST